MFSASRIDKGIIAGKFPRDLGHPVYFHRRLYGVCWTALFYFKPVYFLILTILPLRGCVFRLFGYRGCLDFTIYPDTWIRDLPQLKFGAGAYISNKATLGTNIVLTNGRILVGPICIDEGAVVGHASMLAPGCRIGKDAEIGVGCGLAINAYVDDSATVGGMCGIDNGALVGKGATIGPMTRLGPHARVNDGISIPARSVIPKRTHVKSQPEGLTSFLESERSFEYRLFADGADPGLCEGRWREEDNKQRKTKIQRARRF